MSLIAHYKLDGDAKDSLGNYDGIINGSGSWGFGKLGDATDMTSTNWWITGNNWLIKNDFSYSFWAIKTSNSDTSLGGLVGNHWHSSGPTGVGLHFRNNTNKIKVSTADGVNRPSYTVTLNEPNNQWNHYTLTCSSGLLKLYQNSTLIDTRQRDIVQDTSRSFAIGRWAASYGSYYLNGKIDDVRIYDHELSVKEVKELSQAKVLHYKFNDFQEPNGKITDTSGQGNHTYLPTIGAPTWINNSKLGSGCYEFDKNDDKIVIPNTPQLQITGDITIAFWVYTKSDNVRTTLIDKAYGGEFTINLETGGPKLRLYRGDGNGNSSPYVEIITSAIGKNQWVHGCVTTQGTTARWYVNGVLNSTKTSSRFLGSTSNNDVTIGTGYTNGYLDGYLDDVRIYATPLSADEVKNIYETKASLDNTGNLYSDEFVEPGEKVLIKEQYYTATTRLRSASPPAELDYSDWVEGDSTLGVIILEGWVYLTTTSIIPSRVEFTRVNNDEGLTFNFTSSNTKIVYPNSSWTTGWNYVTVKNPTYRSPSVTDWSNMNRLEIYKNGSNDSTQQIGFKNLKLRKNYDNQPIKKSFQNNGQVKTLEFTESSNFSKSDYLDYTQWNLNTNGSQGSFSRNGGNNENKIILYPNPWGVIVPTWQCIPDSNSNADGGWNASFNSNHTEKLRFSVFVKRTGSKNGTTYLGSENSNHTLRLNGNVNSNPYFWSGDPPNLDEWYLMVGVIHSSSYSGGDTGYAGMYDLGNNRVINFTEYKWAAGETIQEMRAYLYYCTDTDVRQYFLYPRVDIMDGTEPSINDLLQGKEMLVRHSNKGMSIFDNQIKTNHQLIE